MAIRRVPSADVRRPPPSAPKAPAAGDVAASMPVVATSSTHATPTPGTASSSSSSSSLASPPLHSVSHEVMRRASEAPTWATSEYFRDLGAQVGQGRGDVAAGGKGLHVRMTAMQTRSKATTETTPDTVKQQGPGLIARVKRSLAVMAGTPASNDGTAVHLTRPENIESILKDGLRPTTGLYKNLTTYFRKAVYLFPTTPTATQKALNFSTASKQMTATIEIDLSKLDPDKLYKRVLDGALIYLTDDPIPPSALRVRTGQTVEGP